MRLEVQTKNGLGNTVGVTCRDCVNKVESLRKAVDRQQRKRALLTKGDKDTKKEESDYANDISSKRISNRNLQRLAKKYNN